MIVQAPLGRHPEPTRAAYPDESGYVTRDGVRSFYEVYGHGDPTVLFLPTWSLLHSRVWRAQLPYFGRHYRALTFDGRGNGRSDRPSGARAYSPDELAADALAVMDETGTERAVLVALSIGTQWALRLATEHPERVAAVAFIGPMYPAIPTLRWLPAAVAFDRALPAWSFMRFNARYWRRDYRGFVEWFIRKGLPEPHSATPIEYGVGWAHETDPDTLIATARGGLGAMPTGPISGPRSQRELAERVRCPVLVVEGELDAITPPSFARALAKHTGGELKVIERMGHSPGRKPVPVNLALREFVEAHGRASPARGFDAARPKTAQPAAAPDRTRPLAPVRGGSNGVRRALYISSPIGLGHARRDLAIARELRALVPDLEIDWLAQDPVTRVLEAEGERIHPASKHLASESGHFESESAEHDLHCFHAWRRMDEILLANFMLFHDVVEEQRYDLWIGDEAWELDYFLHENPSLKRAPYAWLTDFVGVVPMPDADEYERYLAADKNGQLVDHIAEHPTLRDRSIFVGNPDDLIEAPLGPNLPTIRDWTEHHFDFAGYVTGFERSGLAERERLRDELGYGPQEKICIVTVGGSGVGESLLRRVIAAFPFAKERVPELRMIAVCGPRIDPGRLPRTDGLELRAYVHDLYRHLAACDLAVVQGGLTTAMELTANERPFIYFPLEHHFEQRFHVAHRLDRYGAGRRMEFADSPPDAIAEAIARDVGREVDYRPVETDGARRAAEGLAEML